MSWKYLLLLTGIVAAAGTPLVRESLLAPALAAQVDGAAPTDASERQRYVARSGTVTFRFREDVRQALGFSFVPHGHLDEGSNARTAAFAIDASSSLEVETEKGVFSRIVGGSLHTRGAFLLDKPGERVVIGNPAIVADLNGVLVVKSTLQEEDATGDTVFELESVMIDLRPAIGELRLIGELSIARSWAKTLGFPKAAGAVVGTVVVEVELEPIDDTGMIATSCQSYDTSKDVGRSLASAGSDVLVAKLQSVRNYPSESGITAFAVGTTACNIGSARANWIASTSDHPVIVQNAYRLKDDRFEQIGLSWVKHGFYAVSGSVCGECNDPVERGDQLGVGCSDPYSAALNGIQTSLSPRSTVNAHTGVFPYPWPGWVDDPEPEAYIERRLQVHNGDLDPLFNAGARYFVQGHYILQDDALAGTSNNNASYREVFLEMPEPGVYDLDVGAAVLTQQGQPAVRAWQDVDPSVVETDLQITGEGLFILAAKVSETPAGAWRYSYALQNLNSDQSGSFFSVPIPEGALVANTGFHDVDYHSGDPYDPTDWQAVVADGAVTWSVVSCPIPDNANALRFGTVYSFYFESGVQPAPTMITVGLFKPGIYDEITGRSVGPWLALVDCDADGVSDACELDCGALDCTQPCGESSDCNANGLPDECEADCNENSVADECDIDPTDPDGNGEVSDDCQPNGIPDECEFDCDDNGVPDDCEQVPDADDDGVNDCDDLCLDVPTTVKCACPERGDCCIPGFGCYSDMGFEPITPEACRLLGGVPGCIAVPCHQGCRLGDFDKNGSLDLFDIAAFQRCIGSDASNQECIFVFDGDDDDDVDLEDFARTIHEYFTGP